MPDYPKAIKKIQQENPDVADATFYEAGPIARLFANRNARAIANPFTGNVTYFPDRMQQMSDPEAENVFAHELQHARQIRQQPMLRRIFNTFASPFIDEEYGMRSRELEAFQAERDRSRRLGYNLPDPYTGARDINLPPQMPPLSQRRQNIDRFAQEKRIRGLE